MALSWGCWLPTQSTNITRWVPSSPAMPRMVAAWIRTRPGCGGRSSSDFLTVALIRHPPERKRSHPDRGEDNPNGKGHWLTVRLRRPQEVFCTQYEPRSALLRRRVAGRRSSATYGSLSPPRMVSRTALGPWQCHKFTEIDVLSMLYAEAKQQGETRCVKLLMVS